MTNTVPAQINKSEVDKKKVSSSLTSRAIRQFIEHKLSGPDGGVNFNEIIFNKGKGLSEDFLRFVALNSEFHEQSNAQKEAFKNVNSIQFFSETIRVGVGFESKRRTLIEVLDREFTMTGAQKNHIKSGVHSLSLSNITKHLQKKSSRITLVYEQFPEVSDRPQEQDFQQGFEAIFETKNPRLNEDQKEAISRILFSPQVSEEDVEKILFLFETLEEKQLIVKYFLPTITLQELKEMGIMSEKGIDEYITMCITSQTITNDFVPEKDFIKSIDLNEIVLPTKLLPETVLNKLLAGKGKKLIAEQIEEINQEIHKEFENNSSIDLAPNESGSLLLPFQEKLRALGVEQSEQFKKGSYISGKIKQQDGTFQAFHFVIVDIIDDANANRENKGAGKQITIKNILTSSGAINKNWKNERVPEERMSYSDMFAIFQKSSKNKQGFPEIRTQANIDTQIESGEIEEEVLKEDIHSFEALIEALNTVDKNGEKYSLEKGTSLQVGRPGDAHFWVFQIKSIDEDAHTISLSDGTSQEYMSFQDFFENFKTHKGLRLPKMQGPEDFLRTLQEYSPKAGAFAKIIYDTDRGIFMPEDKKGDKEYPGIFQFGGDKETISLHKKDESGLAGWSVGEWNEKEKKYKGESVGYKAGWNALYAHFLTFRVTPIVPDVALVAPDQKKEKKDFNEKHGYLKHYMGNPSLHDMFAGAKGLLDFVKHKLEHGAKGHSAKFQLALGKKLGFSEEMMRELRKKVHDKTKELMNETIKDLSELPSGERQTEVKRILENHGSHDYEIQAAILAMLKKHGNLYVGGPLKGLEGSFIFFERLSGTKYSQDNIHVQRALKACKTKGVLFREEFLIENYLQFIGGEKGGYQVDWNLWLDVKRGWADGMKGESDSGETNAGAFGTMDGRLNWVYEKFEGGEYSNGIGAMKKVWSKGGPPHKMHEPAMYLALSNISNRLHGSQLDALKNEFYAGGHPYPALTALFTPEKLSIFQKTVKALCEGNVDMKAAYKKVEDTRYTNVGDSIAAIRSFWSTFGPDIHKKLIISQDSEILYRAKNDSDPEIREVLTAYIANYKGDTEAMGKFNEDELGEGVYNYDHSGYTWNPDAFLKNARVDRGPGTIGDDKGTVTMWDGYLQAIDDVKKIQVTEDEIKNKDFQRERFKEYHKAFYKTILQKVGADWGDVGSDGNKKIEKQTYMTDLKDRGFSVPPWREMSKLETPEYDQLVTKDFESYINGIKTIKNETETVATSISSLLDTPSSNDSQSQQAA